MAFLILYYVFLFDILFLLYLILLGCYVKLDALYLIIIEDLSMMVIRSPFAFLAQTTFICTYIRYVQYRSQVTCTIL